MNRKPLSSTLVLNMLHADALFLSDASAIDRTLKQTPDDECQLVQRQNCVTTVHVPIVANERLLPTNVAHLLRLHRELPFEVSFGFQLPKK